MCDKKREDWETTYSEGFDSSELLNDSLLLGEVSSTDGESGGGNDRKTDWDSDNQEDKSVVKKVDRAPHWGGNWQVMEETTNP
jgi:hypothetical protein